MAQQVDIQGLDNEIKNVDKSLKTLGKTATEMANQMKQIQSGDLNFGTAMGKQITEAIQAMGKGNKSIKELKKEFKKNANDINNAFTAIATGATAGTFKGMEKDLQLVVSRIKDMAAAFKLAGQNGGKTAVEVTAYLQKNQKALEAFNTAMNAAAGKSKQQAAEPVVEEEAVQAEQPKKKKGKSKQKDEEAKRIEAEEKQRIAEEKQRKAESKQRITEEQKGAQEEKRLAAEAKRKTEEAKRRTAEAKQKTAETRQQIEEKKAEDLEKKQAAQEQKAKRQAEIDEARKNPNTVYGMQAKVNELRNKMKQVDLDKNSKEFKELNKELQVYERRLQNAKNEMDKFKNASDKLASMKGKLVQMMGAVFSVKAIRNFLKSMIEVTAQFDLQRVALGSIVGNQNKANEMFTTIQQMALHSPYTVMQLTNYNKQLAAYRVETEKLLPKLKMLGDISSGVGVDMSRLILVYGQVKAANYLRGQELRQFSEAGVNVLGELAEHYSKLEGRVVSVGDVFERVSHRLVSFQDVDKVLQKITSTGGIFFDMQARQAETLYGKISNLKDAYQLFLSSIGNDHSINTILHTALDWTRELLLSLKQNFGIVKAISKAVLAFAGVKVLSALIRNFGMLRLQMQAALSTAGKFKALMGSGFGTSLIGIGVSAITFFVSRIIQDRKRLADAMQGIQNDYVDGVAALNKAFYGYSFDNSDNDGLIEQYANATKFDEKLRIVAKTIEELNDKRILIKLDIDSFSEKNAQQLDEFMDNVSEYYNEMMVYRKWTQESIADSDQDRKRKTRRRDNTKWWLTVFSGADGMTYSDLERMKDTVDQSVLDAKTSIRELEYFAVDAQSGIASIDRTLSADALAAANSSISTIMSSTEQIKDWLKASIDLISDEDVKAKIGAVVTTLKEKTEEGTISIQDHIKAINTMEAAYKAGAKHNKQFFENITKESDAYKKNMTIVYSNIVKATQDTGLFEYTGGSLMEAMRDYLKKHGEEEFKREMQRWGTSIQSIGGAEGQAAGRLIGEAVMNGCIEAWKDMNGKEFISQLPIFRVIVPNSSIPATTYNNFQKFYKKNMDEFAETIKNSNITKVWRGLESLMLGEADYEKTFDVLKQSFDGQLEAIAKQLDVYGYEIDKKTRKLKKTKQAASDAAKQELRDDAGVENMSDQEYLNSTLEAYNKLMDKRIEFFGGFENKGSGSKSHKDEFVTFISFIKKLHDETDKMSKTFDKAKKSTDGWRSALERVREAAMEQFVEMPEQFKKAFSDILDADKFDFGNEHVIIHLLERLKSLTDDPRYANIKDKLLALIGAAQREVKLDLDIEVKELYDKNWQEQLQKEFDKYTLYVEVEKLGLSQKDIKDIFGQETNTITDLYKKVEEYRDKAVGEQAVSKYKDFVKKLLDITDKLQQERIRKYAKYLEQTLGKAASIQYKYLKEISEVQGIAEYTPEQKSRIINSIEKERDKELAKQSWEDFKDSDMYVSLFDDLSLSSVKALTIMEKKLVELRGSLTNLDPSGLKEISSKIKSIRDEVLERNPFDILVGSLKEYKEAVKELKDLGIKGSSPMGLNMKASAMNADLGIQIYDNQQQLQNLELIRRAYQDIEIYTKKLGEGFDTANIDQTITTWSTEAKTLKESLEGAKKELDGLKNRNAAGYGQTFPSKAATSKQELDDKEQQIAELSSKLFEIEERIRMAYSLQVSLGVVKDNEIKNAEQATTAIDKLGDETIELEKKKKKLERATARVGERQDAANAAFNKVIETLENLSTVAEAIIDDIDYLSPEGVSDAWKEFTSSLLSNFRDLTGLISNIVNNVIPGLVATATTAGAAINSALGIIGLIATAVQLVTSMIAALVKFNDNKLAAQIDNIKKAVDKLSRSYEKLNDLFEQALGNEKVAVLHQKMLENLDEQIAATREQILLTKQMKKPEDGALEDLEKELEDLLKEREEAYKSFMEEMGGLVDAKSVAEDFVSAWLDAFKETGNGLKGLEDSFDSFFENLVKRQLMHKIGNDIINDFIDSVNDRVTSGNELTNSEAIEIEREWNERIAPELDRRLTALQGLFDSIGLGNSDLSGLQAGIQGITEDTADIIAAYLNSIRFLVNEQNHKLDGITRIFSQDVSVNPMLAQLQLVAANTSAIYSLLNTVVGNNTNAGGARVKVYAQLV